MTRSQSFKEFLDCVSSEKLPITFSDEDIIYFSSHNKTLKEESIRRFLKQTESIDDDEYTEYIPCCKIPDTQDIHAIVYWKGQLMSYEYLLATFDKNGVLLSRKVIAGLKSDGQSIKRSIATIDEDWIIHIMAGEQSAQESLYDADKSRNFTMELMLNGEIIFSLQE